jgi:hypothetical protein
MMHTPKLSVQYAFSESIETHTHGYRFAHESDGKFMATDRNVGIELNVTSDRAQLGWLTVSPVTSGSEQRRRLSTFCHVEPTPQLLPFEAWYKQVYGTDAWYSQVYGEPQHESGGAAVSIRLVSGGATHSAHQPAAGGQPHDVSADRVIGLVSEWMAPYFSQHAHLPVRKRKPAERAVTYRDDNAHIHDELQMTADEVMRKRELLQAAEDDVCMHGLLSQYVAPPPEQRAWPSVRNFVNGITDNYPFLLFIKHDANPVDSLTVNSHDSIEHLQQRCSAKYMNSEPCQLFFAGKQLDMMSPAPCGHTWCPAGFACLPSIGLRKKSTVHVMRIRLPDAADGVAAVDSDDSAEDEECNLDCSSSTNSDSSCARCAKRSKGSNV